jgi:hypothetical protein
MTALGLKLTYDRHNVMSNCQKDVSTGNVSRIVPFQNFNLPGAGNFSLAVSHKCSQQDSARNNAGRTGSKQYELAKHTPIRKTKNG